MSAIIGIIIILSLTPIAFAPSTPMGPFKKIAFVHYFKGVNGVPQSPICNDKVKDYGFIGGTPTKWTSTISYSINPTNSGLGSTALLSAVSSASNTWDASTSAVLFTAPSIDYTAAPSPQEISSGVITPDFKNTVSWADLSRLGFPGSTIGVTYVYFNAFTGQISDFDIVLNTQFSWSTMGAPGQMDVQDIATHELGHAIGLGDLYAAKDCALTMYGYSNFGETFKRTLGRGDILGSQALYGI